MALSEREQQLLDEMERGFYRSEADVLTANSGVPKRVNYRMVVLGILLAVAGVGMLIGGAAIQQMWLGVVGFACMLAGVLLMLSKQSDAPAAKSRSNRPAAKPAGRASKRESFSERMERRWDDRINGA